MSANSTTKTEAKYTGPYEYLKSSIDDKMFWWYRQNETEIGFKCDDQTAAHLRWKFPSGFIKGVLRYDNPEVGGFYHDRIKSDFKARSSFRNSQHQFEFKKDEFMYECDLGAYPCFDEKLWINPYTRQSSKLDFSKNSLSTGLVARWRGQMLRNHLKFDNPEGLVDRKLGEVFYENKSIFKEGKWSFWMYRNYSLNQNKTVKRKYQLSWQDETYGGVVNLQREGDKHTSELFLNYKHDSTLSFGSRYTYHHSKDKQHGFITGLKWAPDKFTTVKANVDRSLLNQLSFNHILANGTRQVMNVQSNLAQWEPNAPAYKGGYMNYPFNYRFVIKHDG